MSKTTDTNAHHGEKRPAEGVEAPKRQKHTAKARYIELAKKYLREHPKGGKYYAVNYRFDMGTDLDVGVYIDFTDKEIKCLHHVLDGLTVKHHLTDFLLNPQGITQDENFDQSYKEAFDSLSRKLAHKQPNVNSEYYCDKCEITGIDFNAATLYTFRRIIFPEGFDKKPIINYFLVRLKDDNDYITLLAIKMNDRNLRFNELRYFMPDEYDYISKQAEYDDPILCTQGPYAIEMTELDKDVFNIIGEKSMSEEIYRESESDDINARRMHTVLRIEEKSLSFSMEDVIWCQAPFGDYEQIYCVNAMEVEKAMGVSDYSGVIEILKTDFGGIDGVRKLKKWLEANSIKFQFQESHSNPKDQ